MDTPMVAHIPPETGHQSALTYIRVIHHLGRCGSNGNSLDLCYYTTTLRHNFYPSTSCGEAPLRMTKRASSFSMN